MGVAGLWPILGPVKQHRTLSSLRGQTLAVDLSIWVCENQAVRQMQSRVLKPHLRNLFFRVSTMLQLGIKLVFVIEGEAPALKHQEMGRRMQARNGHAAPAGSGNGNTRRKFGRGHLKGMLKECCELLDAVGVPYIQSQGEAESTCAALNAAGVVDACVSDDGDCFLYGAKVVYRNLTLDAKDPHVESYSMENITSELGLTRERLVALALLLGCDYFPAGVPGIGETRALKLMTSLAGVDVLKRLQKWQQMTASDCADSTEVFVWRRAAVLPCFPPQQVIEEFLVPKEKVVRTSPHWRRPSILRMMSVGGRYLEWPEEYSLEKILPLATLWDQLCILQHTSPCTSAHLQPCRIVRRRVRQGVPSFEVEWENNIKGLVDGTGQPRSLVTIESEDRFHGSFPQFVESFTQHSEELKAAKAKRSRKPKGKKDADKLASQMEDLKISADPPIAVEHTNQQSLNLQTAKTHSFVKEETPVLGQKKDNMASSMEKVPVPSEQFKQFGPSHVVSDISGQSQATDHRQLLAKDLLAGSHSVVSNAKDTFLMTADQRQLSASESLEQLRSRREESCISDKLISTKDHRHLPSSCVSADFMCSGPEAERDVPSGETEKVQISGDALFLTEKCRPLPTHCLYSDPKQLKKKQTSSSSLKTGTAVCSQGEKKAAVIANLLDDWSDASDNEDSDSEESPQRCSNPHSIITISDDEKDQEPCDPILKGSHTGLPPIRAEGKIITQTGGSRKNAFTPAAGRQHPHSAVMENIDMTPDTASFVSDGHFTLHHTLFTSMEDSDREVSTCSEQLAPEHRSCSAAERERNFKPSSFILKEERSFEPSAVKLQAKGTFKLSTVKLEAEESSEQSAMKLKSQRSFELSRPSSVPAFSCGKSPQDSSMMLAVTHQHESEQLAAVCFTSSFRENDFSVFSERDDSTVFSDMPLASVDHIPPPPPVTDTLSSVDKSLQEISQSQCSVLSQNVNSSHNTETHDDYIFLPLSQRLRLKKVNTKVLDELTHS